MNSREWERLSPEVKDLINRYQNMQPIPLGKLASELGVLVKSSTLPVGISGEIKPDTDSGSGYIIRVNRHENKSRQRFTLAHELAHFLLHRDDIGNGVQDSVLYRSRLSDKREAEANRLAADILMPWSILQEKLKLYQKCSADQKIQKIAEDLGVSTTALEIRLGM